MRMGRSRFPVLILGETGTGKEVVARAIHHVENRGPFVVVDCSSLVGPLMESELFGYSKGAFTGAHNQKLGLLDAANGGTAFFDEIGELPLDLQTKLLRVLQEKEFRAVGGLVPAKFKFSGHRRHQPRLSRRSGNEAIPPGSLLPVECNAPAPASPARAEKMDVPTLIAHFLSRHGNGHGIPTDVMEELMQYDWPGNVRELEHSVQQMVAMNSGPWIWQGRSAFHADQPRIREPGL